MIHPSIRSFLAVAETGSFSKAAEQLYISPTAVIKQISSLEDRLNLKLLVRTYQGIHLTAAGESLYEDSKAIVLFADEAVNRAGMAEEKQRNTIRIGSSQLYPASRAVQFWDGIVSRLPDISLSIVSFVEDDFNDYIDGLEERYDLIYAPFNKGEGLSENGSIGFMETDSTPFCIAMSRKHPLASRSSLELGDLSGETVMIMQRGGSPMNDLIRSEIENRYPGIQIRDISSKYHVGHFNECAEHNELMLSLGIWQNVHPALCHIPLKVPYRIPCGFLYHDPPASAAAGFLEEVRVFLKSKE